MKYAVVLPPAMREHVEQLLADESASGDAALARQVLIGADIQFLSELVRVVDTGKVPPPNFIHGPVGLVDLREAKRAMDALRDRVASGEAIVSAMAGVEFGRLDQFRIVHTPPNVPRVLSGAMPFTTAHVGAGRWAC